MIRNLLYMAVVGIIFSSCSALKPVSSHTSGSVKRSSNSPEFMSDISITPPSMAPIKKNSGSNKSKQPTMFVASSINDYSSTTESLSSLQFKYGIMLNVAVERLTNVKLLETIDEWYGSKYRYGGNSKAGIDCSAFTGILMTAAYGSTLPRTAREQYATCQRIEKDDLQEGDLVFFNTTGGVSHVGVYLDNNKFVHASRSSGVIISDLNETYFSKKYIGAGRVIL